MKVAIVHHWLTNHAGAESVTLEMLKLYPDADIYTSAYDREAMPRFHPYNVRTTWIQKVPLLRYKHQLWAPLRPFAFRSLNLKAYDLIISSGNAEEKNVRARKDAIHINYCNTPIRYYWSHYGEYKADPGFGAANWLARIALQIMIDPLKGVDKRAAQKVDFFIANSTAVQARIKKYYERDSKVIWPPVDVSGFKPAKKVKRSGYLIAGRQTPYKRVDLAILACNKLKLPLTVVGNGSEHEKLKDIAGPTIRFAKNVDNAKLHEIFWSHEAFIFPAEEDFGITPIEAMAAGMPVLAFAKGGSEDWMVPGKTGEVFNEQTVDSLAAALKDFKPSSYSQKDLSENAQRFNTKRFHTELKDFVESSIKS